MITVKAPSRIAGLKWALRGCAWRGLLMAVLAAVPTASYAADAPTSIRVGYVDLVNAQILAKVLGLTEKAVHRPVKWIKFESGGDLNRGVAAGGLDFGGVGNPPATIGITQGLPYEGIVVLDELGPVESLVARSGIKSIEDLKGKTIATPFGSTSHYELIAALAAVGIGPADAKILDMDPSDALAAWTRHDIDAAYLWQPVLGKMEASGGKVLMDSGTMARRGYPTWDVGVVMKDFAAKYPHVVVDYLKAECQAIDYWHQHPKKSAELIAKDLGLSVAETTREMSGTYMIPCHQQLTADYLGTPQHKGKFVATLISTAKFLKSQNRLPEVKPDSVYSDFINPSYLETAMKR
jgi:taurine transport system substrate-binding protein